MPEQAPDEKLSELEKLQSSKALVTILSTIPTGVIIVRASDGKILRISAYLARLIGRPRREMEGLPISDTLGHVPTYDEAGQLVPVNEQPLARALRGETVTGFEVVAEGANGQRIPVVSNAEPIRNARGDLIGTIAVVRDVRRHKALERSLRESEQQFRELANTLPQLVWMADPEGWIYWYNRRWYEYTGMTEEEPKGWGWRKAHHPEHVDRVVERIQRAWETGEPWEDTFPLRDANGRYRWFLSRALPTKDSEGRVTGWFGTNTDVTEQLVAQELLRTLLREVGHRVKNSLALASSLLKLQARTLEGDARKSLEEASRRVQTISCVHDQLWRSAESREIDLKRFLTDLCSSIATAAPRHETVCRAETATVGSKLAVPLGLLVNELLTNAYKYAYAEGEEGEVRLLGTREPEERYRLEVADSGRGLPSGFDAAKGGKGLGMRVITSMATQLGGELTVRSAGPGTCFSLVFPLSPPAA